MSIHCCIDTYKVGLSFLHDSTLSLTHTHHTRGMDGMNEKLMAGGGIGVWPGTGGA